MSSEPSPTPPATPYRERIDDGRLNAVAEHVRAWLFAPTTRVGQAAGAE
jgi:hypothetical protein